MVLEPRAPAQLTLTEIVPTEYRADLVLVLGANTPVYGIVVEVQLARDPDKSFVWPLYLAALRARLRVPCCLLVVTPDQTVADWAARAIDLGHPGTSFAPLVLGPAGIPVITDVEQARRIPELSVLSVLAHGGGGSEAPIDTDRLNQYVELAKQLVREKKSGAEEQGNTKGRETMLADLAVHGVIVPAVLSALGRKPGEHGFAIARAALASPAISDSERVVLYTELAFSPLGRAAYMALMDAITRYQARLVNLRQGKAEGKAESLLTVFAARGFSVPETVQRQILATTNLDDLDRWIRRSVTASSFEEALDERSPR